jgi:ABC-type Zn uptake system ZnuABC Zn-binding protein ZnuA
MKRILILILLLLFLMPGCSNTSEQVQIVATTTPVYEFTKAICKDTDIQITQLITENVSCLHDYTLQSHQMHLLESADLVLLSGFGLEDFLNDALNSAKNVIDTSTGITPICAEAHDHSDHIHDVDPHIWLSPENAATTAENIYNILIENYPQYSDTFQNNYHMLSDEFIELQNYAEKNLAFLSCRKLITFHDGFSYMANAFHLEILHAIEEESGSEASAKELIHMIEEVEHHKLPAIFTEKNGSVSAAGIIARETGAKDFALDMAMAGNSYFEAMYHNIDTVKEALG